MKLRLLLLLLMVPSMVSLWGQTSVEGRVFDGGSGQALPFVNVSFGGTNIGTMTDVDGRYALDAGKDKVTRVVV